MPLPVPLPIVLFDLDGTLTDSAAGIVASYSHVLASLGMHAEEADIRRGIGPPLAQALASLGVPATLMDQAITAYREVFARRGLYDNRVYPGTTEMLEELGRAGTTLGVATSKLDQFARAILEHFRLSEYFTVVSGSSRDGARSHKVDVLAHALEELGGPAPSSVALVGDREHDMYAARQLGVWAIGVTWGYGPEDELVASGAHVLAHDQAELSALVLGA